MEGGLPDIPVASSQSPRVGAAGDEGESEGGMVAELGN